MHTVFWWKMFSERDDWDDLDVDGDNIKMDFQEVGWGMDFFALAQDRDRYRALVNAIQNHRVPRNTWYFLTG